MYKINMLRIWDTVGALHQGEHNPSCFVLYICQCVCPFSVPSSHQSGFQAKPCRISTMLQRDAGWALILTYDLYWLVLCQLDTSWSQQGDDSIFLISQSRKCLKNKIGLQTSM